MSEVDEILKKWDNARVKKHILEGKIESYKQRIGQIMNREQRDRISGRDHIVTRSRVSKSTVSKRNLPSDLWKEYSTTSTYDTFRLVKK